MPRIFIVRNLNSLNWKEHEDFEEYISDGCIQVGDNVKVENKDECPLPLTANEFCLTFDNDKLFIEEPFTLNECVLLFGEQFRTYVK